MAAAARLDWRNARMVSRVGGRALQKRASTGSPATSAATAIRAAALRCPTGFPELPNSASFASSASSIHHFSPFPNPPSPPILLSVARHCPTKPPGCGTSVVCCNLPGSEEQSLAARYRIWLARCRNWQRGTHPSGVTAQPVLVVRPVQLIIHVIRACDPLGVTIKPQSYCRQLLA